MQDSSKPNYKCILLNGLTYNVGDHFTSFERIFSSQLLYDIPEKELRFSKDLHAFGVGNGKLFQVK